MVIKKPCQLIVDRVIKFGSDSILSRLWRDSRLDPFPFTQPGLTSVAAWDGIGK